MTIRHQDFYSKWHTSAQSITPLHGGAASGLKSVTHPHCVTVRYIWVYELFRMIPHADINIQMLNP